MDYHIKVGDKSLCHVNLHRELPREDYLAVVDIPCSAGTDRAEGEVRVQRLREKGVDARLVEGICDQQDDDFCNPSYWA